MASNGRPKKDSTKEVRLTPTDLEHVAMLQTINAEILQVIDQICAVAHGTADEEEQIALRNVVDTLVTAPHQIRHRVNPDWFKKD